MVSVNPANKTFEVEDATKQERAWIRCNSAEYGEMGTHSGVDVTFVLSEDAKLEELLNMGAR